MTIPRLSERVECMVYRRKLEVEVEEVRPELNMVRNASHQLRESSRFRRVLQVSVHSSTLRLTADNPLQTVLAVGHILNSSSFRGGARGFQLNALNKVRSSAHSLHPVSLTIMQLKETKTASGGTECPTLLHYLARVLLRTDPSLVMFIEEMPHLEPAARGRSICDPSNVKYSRGETVSVPTVIASVQSLTAGLAQLKEEVAAVQRLPTVGNDRFVTVMQVSPSLLCWSCTDFWCSHSCDKLRRA